MTSPEPVPPEAAGARARGGQSFWSVVVGVPAIFSVLRLGVEAGGELQTTLLLVANVDPINLIAALFTTGARFASAALVGVLAIGGVALASHQPGQGRPALFARWLRASPLWFAVAAFGLAAITWQIMYLPLLLPCVVAAFQSIVTIPPDARWKVTAAVVAGFIAYIWLVGSTVVDAAGQGDWLVFVLFTAPPLLALGIRGPLPRTFVGGLTLAAQTVALILVATAAIPMITTPVLPLTVTTVSLTGPATSPSPDPSDPATSAPGPDITGTPSPSPDGTTAPSTSAPSTPAPSTSAPVTPAPEAPGPDGDAAPDRRGGDRRDTEDILGHVITVDDVNMVILQESGGVRYVPTDLVQAQVLCPSEGELPRYRLWVRGFHVEGSLLEGLGRQVRPASRVDAACRNPVAG